MSDQVLRVVPFGERAFLVELGNHIDEACNARVHALAARLDAGDSGIDGLERCVPAYASLLVPFDPERADAARLPDELRALALATMETPLATTGRTVEVEVAYGGEQGPDLADVAQRTGLTSTTVAELHASVTYRVFMLGFAPGFAYLGTLPEPLRLPRRSEPRTRVPAGSVAIAAAQTAVYPHVSAGGWHLLGRTEMCLWDPVAPEPATLRPGDHVRFVPS